MDINDIQHFLTDTRNSWLVAAVFFMLVEALGAPGVGLFFAGIGALVTGICVYGGFLAADAYVMQFSVFFAASAVCAAALWKPLKAFQSKKDATSYHNMIGQMAVASVGGVSRDEGRVTWSGTIMHAELSRDSKADSVAEGGKLIITDIKGSTLIVLPKAEYHEQGDA